MNKFMNRRNNFEKWWENTVVNNLESLKNCKSLKKIKKLKN